MQNAETNDPYIVNSLPKQFSVEKLFIEESTDRKSRIDKNISYGVSFLDDALDGIAHDDLIVYGAKTGAGKTQLAIQISISAAKKGKRVLLFALESTQFEVSRRMKFGMLYKHLVDKYRREVGYGEWNNGFIEEDENIKLTPEPWMANIDVVLRLENFGLIELEKYILAGQLVCDLIIIDHLHYLDLEGDNENREVKTAVKTIRAISQNIGKAIILISHIRKPSKFDKMVWPTIDDFHGSSEISKIATHAFSMSSNEVNLYQYGNNSREKVKSKTTVFTVLKNRNDANRVGKQASVSFDYSRRLYLPSYKLIEYSYEEEEFNEVDEMYFWAKHATNKWR